MEEVLVRREVPLPRDGQGKTLATELLRSVRQVVQAARRREPTLGRRLSEVGLKPRRERDVVEVVLYFR